MVGFDSGEVQCYSGLPGTLRVGSGFRVSADEPVEFVRVLEKPDRGFQGKSDEETRAVR